jgi:alpha-beta hydrolase superfamily lysophospholipase
MAEIPIRGSRRKRITLVTSTVLSSLILFGYAGISIVSAHVLTRSNNRVSKLNPAWISPKAVDWSTRTADGLKLHGWYFPGKDTRHLIVLVHGMRSSWDEMPGIAHDLARRGYSVLTFDLRGHGQSDPSRLYMGSRERRDVRAVLAWAKSQGFSEDRIGWIGYSMGASILVMEGAANPAIRAAVLDSPYGNLPVLLDEQLSEHSGLPSVFNPGIVLAARFLFGVRTDNLVPIRDAPRLSDRPVLLIHGESDTTVHIDQARRLARALGPRCRALFLPGVEHVDAYNDNPPAYVNTVVSFFRKNLAA